MASRRALVTVGLGLLLAAGGGPAAAQDAQEVGSSGRVRVFLDCQSWNCDSREFRTEIRFVDWVNERAVSDVHVMMTSQGSGAGTEYVLDFEGGRDLAGLEERLTHAAADTDTEDEVLRALTSVMRAGLVRYIAHRGYAGQLEIQPLEAEVDRPRGNQLVEEDPWNQWVFDVGIDFELDGEERENSREFRADLSANRTTPQWKMDLELEGILERRDVELNDGRIFIDDTNDWGFGGLVVRSVGGQWSSGIEVDLSTSTERNRKLGARSAAALEWSLFPYEEANRRQLVIHYQTGLSRIRYDEPTVFDKVQETVGDQRLAVIYDVRQPWGVASAAVSYSTLINDWSKFSVSFDAGMAVRLFRGLELEVEGAYEFLRDQIYLSAAGLSDEEILVQRRQLATGYEYQIEIGVNYRFGSIFNNVVNNRFPWNLQGF